MVGALSHSDEKIFLLVSWGVPPYISHIGMYHPKEYGFSVVFV